ncbi:hypothetical protein CRUP_025103 [Coryphaenoides rupestris]|nr:hypothetical protein CRUP_025103 [Coryphaenoides rupestris]
MNVNPALSCVEQVEASGDHSSSPRGPRRRDVQSRVFRRNARQAAASNARLRGGLRRRLRNRRLKSTMKDNEIVSLSEGDGGAEELQKHLASLSDHQLITVVTHAALKGRSIGATIKGIFKVTVH